MRKRMVILAVLAAIVTCWLTVRWVNAQARPKHTLGVADGELAECPDKPNCVSSTSPRPEQGMPPVPLTCSVAEARMTLVAIIETMPRSRIVTVDDRYLHAEFRSRVFGFVDDAEFLIDEPNEVIHFRASSRVGHSDLGVNRKRMVEIGERFQSSHSNVN